MNHSAPSLSVPVDRDSTLRQLTFWILIAATTYQSMLCLVHTHLFSIRTSIVGMAEFVIYLGCLIVLVRRLRLEFTAIITLIAAYLLFLALLRGAMDFKGFRDIIIVVLFYWLGRTMGDISMADRLLKILIAIVLVFGLFEMLFVDLYSRVFNVFSYYVSQGGLSGVTNWAKGSTLALNSIRPEGIGRTILPGLLGSHRVSSIFLEPVSLGNFSVIVAAWGLSKGHDEWRKMLFFVMSAVVMITLCDSRYGMVTVGFLVVMRMLFVGRMHTLAMLLPLICVAFLIALVLALGNYQGDNIMGRLYVTGTVLMNFNVSEILGLQGFNINFGDMGYAVVLTRFGLILCTILWIAFWMIKMKDERGIRFRAYIALYISLILAISGTSLMALKTAGVLWFLIGCCVLRDKATVHARNNIPFRKASDPEMNYAN